MKNTVLALLQFDRLKLIKDLRKCQLKLKLRVGIRLITKMR